MDEYSHFLKEFEEETKSKFVILRVEAPFNDKEWQPPAEIPRVYWEWSRKSIPFSGVPFIFVGSTVMVCHQGKDFDLKRKMERRAAAKSKETDHSCLKRRCLLQDTKKVGCPAEVHITWICTFPAFKLIGRDSLRARQAAGRRLRDALAKDPVVWENLYIVKTPSVSAHEGHPVMGKAADIREPVDSRVERRIVELTKQKVKRSTEMRRHIEQYVNTELFRGESPPPFTSRRFYPSDQDYSPENVPGPGCEIDPAEVTLPGCNCHSQSCQQGSCSCLQTHGQAYDSLGLLKYHRDKTGYSLPVFECSALCGCSEACSNRVVQRGLGLRLCLFPTHGKGLGVRALEPIPQGMFVCEYAGEVIGFKEACWRQRAQKPGDMNYIIVVREHAGEGKVGDTIVDPGVVGNIGHFLNSSCQPNLFMVPVRVHSLVPTLALFAGRDIAPGEELSFDYSGGYNNPLGKGLYPSLGGQQEKIVGEEFKRKPCLCGADNCRLFLPLDISIIGNT